MARKYLKGGALNPIWCDEQDAEIFADSIVDSLSNLFGTMDIDLNLQFGEGIDVNISNKRSDEKEMCSIVNTENDFEAKFDFLKRHSDTPEDLELAMRIIGLK